MKGNEEGIMKGIQRGISPTKGAFEGPWICNTVQALIKVKLTSNGETKHHLDFFLTK